MKTYQYCPSCMVSTSPHSSASQHQCSSREHFIALDTSVTAKRRDQSSGRVTVDLIDPAPVPALWAIFSTGMYVTRYNSWLRDPDWQGDVPIRTVDILQLGDSLF